MRNSGILSQLATVLLHLSHLWGKEGEMCQMGRGLPGEMSCCKPSPGLLHVLPRHSSSLGDLKVSLSLETFKD